MVGKNTSLTSRVFGKQSLALAPLIPFQKKSDTDTNAQTYGKSHFLNFELVSPLSPHQPVLCISEGYQFAVDALQDLECFVILSNKLTEP
jgi:hypothetical protein